MYQVDAFREERIDVMHSLMRKHRFSTLVTVNDGLPEANHLPLLIDPEPLPRGSLRGHVARANPVWRQAGGQEVLAIFHGPQVYVTPSWYPSKSEAGRVVPTWNYAVVHAYGPLVVHDDRDWLHALLTQLTDQQEATLPLPWRVDDAPADYLERMLGGIVGIEIPLTRLMGKWKVSQNRSAVDRAGVVDGLAIAGDEQSLAMADLVAGKRPV
jgi:transcriptional regulator